MDTDGDGPQGSGQEGGGGDPGEPDGEQDSEPSFAGFTKDDITTFAVALGISFVIRS